MADVPAPTPGMTGGAAAGTPVTGDVTGPIAFDPRLQIGRSGLKQYGGFIFEEFLHTLRGKEGARAYREVIDNSPLVGGIMRLLKLTMRQVNKFVSPFEDTAEDQERAERLEQALDDMSVTWADVMAEVATMLGYGYAPMEIVWKKCEGWSEDGMRRSRFDDGLIMPRKIYLLAQDTLFRWQFDADGGVRAFVQLPPPDYIMRVVPIEKLLLFRPENEKGNPEGNSLIRSGYYSWVMVKRLIEFEAIQGERDAVGVPVARIPANNMLRTATTNQQNTFNQFKKVVQNLRIDDQAGIVIPSDLWPGTNHPMFNVELLTSHQGGGTRFDFGSTITRHEVRLAISMLADIMLLGHDQVGSFALSQDKRSMLADALNAWMDSICAVFTRHLFTRIFAYNGWPMDRVPMLQHGGVEEDDVDALAGAVLKLSQAGMPLFPDVTLENHVREEMGWPEIKREGEEGGGGPPLDLVYADAYATQAGMNPDEEDDTENGDTKPGSPSRKPDAKKPSPSKKPAGKKPSARDAKKFRHQPRNMQQRYSPRSGDIASALNLLATRAGVGRVDEVNHGFHVAERPYDVRAMNARVIDRAPTERLKLKSLTATQATVRRDGVQRFLTNPGVVAPGQRALTGELVDRPVVVRDGDKAYINDGHHRLAARALLGYEDALVRVVEMDGLPANQGTPRGASPTATTPQPNPSDDLGPK